MTREERCSEAAYCNVIDVCKCGNCDRADNCQLAFALMCDKSKTYIHAFMSGAEWADKHPKEGLIDLNKVWRDTSEQPEEETWILATNEKDIIDVYHLRKGRKYNFDGNLIDWSKFVVNFNLTKWAYINDLLPKGGNQ
jgi:hypothetical protein